MRRRNTPGPKQATSRTSPVLVAKAPPEADMPRLPDADRRIYAVGSSCIGGLSPRFSVWGRCSAGEVGFRRPGHIDLHGEDPARLRQPCQLVRIAPLAR